MRMRRVTGVLVLAALGACDDGSASASRTAAAVDTVGGVERWSYPETAASSLGWSVDTVGVLGDAFADDEYQFAEVSWERLAGDADGNLFVLDRQGSRVLKYGPDGRHLATYGRKGEGPGELSQPLGLAVGPGDTLWVTDFSNSRLTGYPQPGGDPRTVPYGDNSGVPSPSLTVLDGGFLQSFRPLFNIGGPPGSGRRAAVSGGEGGSSRLPLLRLGPTAEVLDTVWTIPEPPTDMVRLEIGSGVIVMMMARQFAPAFRWQGFSDGGVVVSDTAAYLIRLIGPDGAVRRTIERAPAPRPVTEEDREAARQRLRDAEEAGGTRVRIGGSGPDEETRRRMLEQRLEKMTFASLIPRVVSLRVDPRGRIWVGVAESVPDSVGRIDIYDRDGTLVGELRGVPMPDVFVGSDRLGVLRKDEMEVQQVVLMRLREDAAAGDGA
ncbi:MAG TPA: hypothetical protein VMM12_04570 [Longimicrobiales bacterium]|nr:hypothetical protein [Longimicrobiales bacterium]